MDQQQQQNDPEHYLSDPDPGAVPLIDAAATDDGTGRRQTIAVPMVTSYLSYAPPGHHGPFPHADAVAPFELDTAMDLDPDSFAIGAGWPAPVPGLRYSSMPHVADDAAGPSMDVFEYFQYDDGGQALHRSTAQEPMRPHRFDRALMPNEPPPGYLYQWAPGSDVPSLVYNPAAVAVPVHAPVPALPPRLAPPPQRPALSVAAAPAPSLLDRSTLAATAQMPPPMPGTGKKEAPANSSSSMSETPRSSSSSGGRLPPMYGNPASSAAADAEGGAGVPSRRGSRPTARRTKTMPHHRSGAGVSRRPSIQAKPTSPMSPSPLAGSSSEGSGPLPATALPSTAPLTRTAAAATAAAKSNTSSSAGSSIPRPLREESSATGGAAEDKKSRSPHNLVEKQYRSRLNAQFKGLMSALPEGIMPPSSGTGSGSGTGDSGRGSGARSRADVADSKHHSKAEVLEMARMHIQSLEQERDTLVRERDALLNNVRALQGGYSGPPALPVQDGVHGDVANDDDDDDDDDDEDADADADVDLDAG